MDRAAERGQLHTCYMPEQVAAYFAAATQAARAGGVPCALPRTVDTGQRLVGIVRPGHESVLRPAGRPTFRRFHHAQRHGLPGGCRGLVAGRRARTEKRPSMPMHTQRPPASTLRPSRPQRLAGTRHWGNTSSTGTMSSPAVTRTGLRSPSPAQRFNTPVASARGIRALRQAPKVLLRPSRSSAPSPELGSHLGMGLLRPSRPAGMHSLSALLHTRWPCPDECF